MFFFAAVETLSTVQKEGIGDPRYVSWGYMSQGYMSSGLVSGGYMPGDG